MFLVEFADNVAGAIAPRCPVQSAGEQGKTCFAELCFHCGQKVGFVSKNFAQLPTIQFVRGLIQPLAEPEVVQGQRGKDVILALVQN